MATAREVGSQGETLARQYLERQGLRFLAANWRCKLGEIDLIMVEVSPPVRVFVEVRLRRPTSYGAGHDTVAWQKQRKLLRTVRYYQQAESYWGNIRFDVVSITLPGTAAPGTAPIIEHIPHAFTA